MSAGHVRLAPAEWERAQNLVAHRERAARAIESAPIGERTAIVKYMQLTGEIERIAYAAWSGGAPIDGEPSELSIRLEWPFALGATPTGTLAGGPSNPPDAWRTSDPRASRTAATYERFLGQIGRWSTHTEGSKPPPLRPSGIQNRALTEAFRRFAGAERGRQARVVPVTYMDGSNARPFPIHAVELSDTEPEWGRVLRFTLLSVRHFSMDAAIDGAWLRNREISLPRPRADTDEIVYLTTRDQLKRLASEPIVLYLFQTGLEAAITGFYRGLLDHLRATTASIAVIPHFFAGVIDGEDRFQKGVPWTRLGR